MNGLLPDTLNHILAVRLDNLGDVVMTGPALRALKEAYPASRLTLLASQGGALAAPLLPWIDSVIVWKAVWQDIAKNVAVDPQKEQGLFDLLAQHKFDAAVIFTSFSQSPYPPAYALYMAQIPIRVGQSKEFGGGLLTHWVRPLPDPAYQVDRNLHLLREIGLPVHSADIDVVVSSPHQRCADGLLERAGIALGQPFLALAPGASAVSRRYPDARFAQAAGHLMEATGLPIVLIGSSREMGRFPTLESQAGRNEQMISLIGQTNVPEMAAVIQRSALLIGNNSGAMHIAAGLKRPMVILFAGTELFEQWVPRSPGVRILNQPTQCAPCYRFECPYHLECLDIPAEDITQAVLELLDQQDIHSRTAGTPGLSQW